MAHGCSILAPYRGFRWWPFLASFVLFLGLGVVGPAGFSEPPIPLSAASLNGSPDIVPPSFTAQQVIDTGADLELLRDAQAPARNALEISPDALILPRVIEMDVTAYCACKKCCGSHATGITASGLPITHNGGHFVAADLKVLPYFTKVIIPGYADGKPVQVIDRGGAIRGNHIDIFLPTHKEAMAWGKKRLRVTVVE